MKKLTILKITMLLLLMSGGTSAFSQEKDTDHFHQFLPTSLFSSDFDIGLIAQVNEAEFYRVMGPSMSLFSDVQQNLGLDASSLLKLQKQKTFEDILEDYKKSELNKHFFKGYDMWDRGPRQIPSKN